MLCLFRGCVSPPGRPLLEGLSEQKGPEITGFSEKSAYKGQIRDFIDDLEKLLDQNPSSAPSVRVIVQYLKENYYLGDYASLLKYYENLTDKVKQIEEQKATKKSEKKGSFWKKVSMRCRRRS